MTMQPSDMPSLDGNAARAMNPVDDRTYNILQALTSTLEAIDAYQIYASEGDDVLFEALIESNRKNAEQLLAALRSSLSAPEP